MANRFLNNIKINDSYTLPPADGTADQIITTDGAGQLSFADLSSIDGASSNFVYFDVKNETGSLILKGKGVMAVGTDGNSGHILIDEMVADGSVESKYFLGVLEEDIPNGGFARVISFGQLSQFNTNGQNGETWADGQVLWCDPANNGDFTITEPDGPNVKIAAAFILNSSTNGKIQVRVQANEGIHDLHDTKITSQVDGDVLVWDNTTGVWFNDSTLNVDYTNGRVGIGTTNPSYKLHVSGNGFFENGSLSIGTTSNVIFNYITTLCMVAGSGQIISLGGGPGNVNNDVYVGNGDLLVPNGKVGIGTTSPSRELDIDGNIQLSDPSFVTTRGLYGANGPMITYNALNFDTEIAGGAIRYNPAFLQMNFKVDGNNDFLSHDGGTGETIFSYSGSEKMRIEGNGNVGINTTNPTHKLQVVGDGAFNSTLGVQDPDVSSYGSLTLYHNSTGSSIYSNPASSNTSTVVLRLGINNSEKMRIANNGNVGIGLSNPSAELEVWGSLIAGVGNTASGSRSQAFGVSTNATANQAAAFGNSTLASGNHSTAFGNSTVASNVNAFTTGLNTAASGPNSFCSGESNEATGDRAFAIGKNNTASGFQSFVSGIDNTASGGNSAAIGRNLNVTGSISVGVGRWNDDTGNYYFHVGAGSSDLDRKNALAVTKSGDILMKVLKDSSSYADDTAAAAGGVPIGGLYRNGNIVQIRLS